MVSRVVPGIGETMARSRPRSWLSRLDLPALGRPMMAPRMPRRRICPSLAVRSSWSMNAMPRPRRSRSCSRRVRADVFVGKIDVRLDVGQRLDHWSPKLIDAAGKLAGKLFVGGLERQLGPGMDEVSHRLGLGKVYPAVQKGAPREFPRLGQARATGQDRVQDHLGREDAAVAGDFDHVLCVKVRGARITATRTWSTVWPSRTICPK